jgi:hypothetical protein
MQGRGTDTDRAREVMSQDADAWAQFRPDILGSVVVGHAGGGYTVATYFTSEADAREGERKELPAALAAQVEEMNRLTVGEPEFFDLKRPWLHAPR